MRALRQGALYAIFLVAASLLLVEAVLRGYFALQVGPSVLLYGTRYGGAKEYYEAGTSRPLTVSQQRNLSLLATHKQLRDSAWVARNRQSGYEKYHPNQGRVDFDPETGERFRVAINGHGFRGADFDPAKEPGVVRIVTLGASSTFGYFNRDDQTYPSVLQDLLDERCGDRRRYEVLNLGIPHLTSRQILALYRSEVVPLHPDIVTLYAGRNDSLGTSPRPREGNWLRAVTSSLAPYVLSLAFLDKQLDLRGLRFSRPDFEARAKATTAEFIANLSQINEEAALQGATVIVATQQASSQLLERAQMRGVTYDEEVAMVQKRIDDGAVDLSKLEITLLGHAELMRALRAWARSSQVPLVDVIAALDQHRDVLLSWVHLNPEGNRRVADAYSREILARTCPQWASPDVAQCRASGCLREASREASQASISRASSAASSGRSPERSKRSASSRDRS